MTARTVALGLAGLIFISLTTAAHAGGPSQRAAAARAEKAQDGPSKAGPDFRSYEWTEINPDARWAPRAGLQVVHLRGAFLLMGGRTPLPPSDPIIPGASEIWGDVWKSEDRGVSWFEILETDAAKARELARGIAQIYINLPNYRNNWLRMGLTEDDFENGGSDRFIDATFAWGDVDAISARLKAHVDAGASHVCIQPVNPNGQFGDLHWEVLEALAPNA